MTTQNKINASQKPIKGQIRGGPGRRQCGVGSCQQREACVGGAC